MAEQLLIKTFVAGETLAAHRFVKASSTDGEVTYADAGEVPFGITDRVGSPPTVPAAVTVASGERVDVVLMGITDILLAGSVSFGDFIVPTADGKGITADPSGTECAGGIALADGDADEIIPVLIVRAVPAFTVGS